MLSIEVMTNSALTSEIHSVDRSWEPLSAQVFTVSAGHGTSFCRFADARVFEV